MSTIAQSSQCRHCTVPVPAGQDVCGFCATYTPPETPAQRLDVVVNRVDLLRHDLNELFQEIVATAPLFAVVDVLAALGHLRHAAVAIDKAADAIEADHKAVAR